ncbi:hypothetical protein [Adhaeribacter rhizoryzae]|uniref:Uncharacterized protein n=1 Tax=Adhaeribacter rhizoryzae TaxID=2607907 RepID=A0A5M6D0L0_9BACT|nr:hypothetical protein [Adhaeribacter rhizoryzae]KAA5539129.1 hypothetical protein F0145_25000 [Adhaeribacter rhizoryzae]
MVLEDFLRLTQAERAEHVWHFGSFLNICEDIGNLYDMDGFYAEVVYNHNLNEIQEVRAFQSIEELDPYLNQIKLGQL